MNCQSKTTPTRVGTILCGVLLAGLAGCAHESGDTYEALPPGVPGPAADSHAHPSEGPHHGDLIELGDEEYHAELVHDDAAGTVTVYLLDSAAAAAVAVEATEITINTLHDGTPEQFALAASPDAGDAAGRSSRFVSHDAELVAHLDEEHGSATLAVTIGGTAFRGNVTHSHEGGDTHAQH